MGSIIQSVGTRRWTSKALSNSRQKQCKRCRGASTFPGWVQWRTGWHRGRHRGHLRCLPVHRMGVLSLAHIHRNRCRRLVRGRRLLWFPARLSGVPSRPNRRPAGGIAWIRRTIRNKASIRSVSIMRLGTDLHPRGLAGIIRSGPEFGLARMASSVVLTLPLRSSSRAAQESASYLRRRTDFVRRWPGSAARGGTLSMPGRSSGRVHSGSSRSGAEHPHTCRDDVLPYVRDCLRLLGRRRLRPDPLFNLGLGQAPESGRDLCSQPTMSRFQNMPLRIGTRHWWTCSAAASPRLPQ